MAGPNPPVPPGAEGILLRQQQLSNPLTQPLTPDEMWDHVVQRWRGILTSPGDKGRDSLRKQPATIPIDLSDADKGHPVGKGYETVGSIQVLDKDGRQVALGADYFDRGGPENHAEARILRGLERDGPKTVPGGRLVVVVEKDCCPWCENRLRDYAREKGVTEIEIHGPEREHARRDGIKVTTKTAARTSFQDTGKPTTVKPLRTITISHPPVPPKLSAPRPGRGSSSPSSPRTGVVGTLAGLVAGVALGLVRDEMSEEMLQDGQRKGQIWTPLPFQERLKSLENMPKPRIDRRDAPSYFADPNTAKAVRSIDLMTKNLQPFGQELDQHHAKVVGSTNLEIGLLSVSGLPDDECLDFLRGLREQLQIYADELRIVRDNLAAARDVLHRSTESARAAEELTKTVENELVFNWLVDQGVSVEDAYMIGVNLRGYSARVRNATRDVDALHAQVQRLYREQVELSYRVNALYWHVALSPLVMGLKKQASRGCGPSSSPTPTTATPAGEKKAPAQERNPPPVLNGSAETGWHAP